MLTGIIDSGQKIVTNGLVLHLDAAQLRSYPGSGTTWTDLSGNGYNGSLVNGPTFNSANGGSIVFDGTNDFVDFTSDSNLLPTDGLTVEVWFKTGIKDRFIVAKSSVAATNGYNLCGMSNDKIQLIVNSVSVDSVTNITNNVWTNCTATWIPSTSMTLYLNGSQNAINTTSIPAAIINPNSVIEICRRDGIRDYWNGNVSIVRIYNRALSATEVLQNYNATKSRYGL